ncbi:MAG: membrane protein insertase YidC [Acidobacteriota bacterium]
MTVETRRLILAFALSFIVIFAYQAFFAPPIPPPVDFEAAEETSGDDRFADDRDSSTDETSRVPDDAVTEPSSSELASSLADETVEPAPPAEPPLAAEYETPHVVETETLRAQFTNRGAQLVSYVVLRDRGADGQPLDLVRERGADLFPFALYDADGQPHPLNDGLFTVEERVSDDGVTTVTFRHRSTRGDATKIFRFRPDGLLEVTIDVADEAGWSTLVGPGLRNPDADEDERWLQRKAGYKRGEDAETFEPKKRKEPLIVLGDSLDWLTLEDNYFLAAVVPREGVREAVFVPFKEHEEIRADEPRFVPLEAGEDDERTAIEIRLRSGREPIELVTYFGAKRYDELRQLPYGLNETVRWGFLGFLIKPLYFGLEWIHTNVVANYGWAIILMTLLIKLLFFPLTHKAQQSMLKMQELSPKIQSLRNKYRPKLKDKNGRPNPEAQRQMNEEMMRLYKETGANPAMGCLPMLIQLPVFYAFFRLLSTAVELRNAPWLGWLQDLSKPDPIYLLPIGMLVTSVLLQRMTPPPPDPMQRRMMQMMPIMFGLFAIAFPAGLVLYWMTNNLLSMVQTSIYMRSRNRQKAAESANSSPRKESADEEEDSESKDSSGKGRRRS